MTYLIDNTRKKDPNWAFKTEFYEFIKTYFKRAYSFGFTGLRFLFRTRERYPSKTGTYEAIFSYNAHDIGNSEGMVTVGERVIFSCDITDNNQWKATFDLPEGESSFKFTVTPAITGKTLDELVGVEFVPVW